MTRSALGARAGGIFLDMSSSARKRKFIVYVTVSADGFIAKTAQLTG
jgi:hypothetical protein